jgi:hypothetical protein
MCGTYESFLLNGFFTLEWLMRVVVGCTVVGRKVELTQGNGRTKLVTNQSGYEMPIQQMQKHSL